MISEDEKNAEDKKTRGRPRRVEDANAVADTRRVLSRSPRYLAISGVSGEPLNRDAMACMIWFLETRREQQGARRNKWTPPDPVHVDLLAAREKAIANVKTRLIARGLDHVDRARRGEKVYALRMTEATNDGAHYMPALGDWPGLPGLYSRAWPTTIGLPGEASVELARDAVARGGFELVELDCKGTERVHRELEARLKREEPDEASIWEQVVSSVQSLGSREAGGWTGARKVARLIKEACDYEYQFPGMEQITRRKPLPEHRELF